MATECSFTVKAPKPVEEVFDLLLADLRNLPTWDPEIDAVEMTSEGEVARVGATFRLTRERRLAPDVVMDYEIIELERPRRIVARATSSQVSGVDTFTVSPTAAGGAEVLYDTDIEPKGLAKLATPVVGAAVNSSGNGSRDGLERALTPG